MRVFLDTNVWVAALSREGFCARLARLLPRYHEMIVGEPVIEETLRILAVKFHLPADLVARAERELRRHRIVPRAESPVTLPINDPDDEWIVATALLASVNRFVTGDKALLGLGQAGAMRILSPREASDILLTSRVAE